LTIAEIENYIFIRCLAREFQTAARAAISSGQQRHFANDEKNNVEKNCEMCLWKICWFGTIWHIRRQSHYVRRPILDLFRISLCGPRTKKFGDPC